MGETAEKVEKFLLDSLNASKGILKDWERSEYLADNSVVSKFWNHVNSAPAYAVVGDYDGDGVFGELIYVKALQNKCGGKKIYARIPKRNSEGYGINETIANEIREKLPVGSVVITVDNGIAAASVLEGLERDGYKVLLTDHHSLAEGVKVPDVTMVINPSVPGCDDGFSFKKWCGAAVAYKLCEQVVPKELSEELSIYAGVATVGDCMELTEGNWSLVKKTIRAFRGGKAPSSLKNMLIEMNQDPSFANEDSFGFYIVPCINAAGRLIDNGATLPLKYLLKPTEEGLKELIDLNNQRKKLRDEEYYKVKSYIEENGMEGNCPMVVCVKDLHLGIIGILAGKLTEEYGVPSVVLTNDDEKGVYKGSARSVGDVNMIDMLLSAEMEYANRDELKFKNLEEYKAFKKSGDASDSLFVGMGGHQGAAGLSIKPENLGYFQSFCFEKSSIRCLEAENSKFHIESFEIPEIFGVMEEIRPFGEGNPSPTFSIDFNLKSENARMVGKEKQHLVAESADKKYKVTHWFHNPNNLENTNVFGMDGKITGSSYGGVEIPTFNADRIYDIMVDRKDRDYLEK